MGIQGLLPLLKDIQRKVSVSEFCGKSVGIDGYCWLHKGVYGCAKDVVEGRKTNVYINYVLKRINMLLNYNIKPVMVFDGGYLPAKASKEKERRGLRQENLKKAKALLRAGNTSQAYECFQRCVEITPAMATEVIQACRNKNVLCIVAPYEADAQLAYLEMQGITDFTITEDSDLLIYGCKRVLFKMNSDGDGIFINLAELNKVKTVALESFTMEKFRHMCILSGCDYLPSIKGLGLYKAHKYLKKSTNVFKAIQLIRQEKKLNVPTDYEEDFRKTDSVFKYQSVFDPRSKKIVRLNEVTETDLVTDEELSFAGPKLDEGKAIKIALGNIDPISGETLADFTEFLSQQKPKEPTLNQQGFIELPSKPRNPNLCYSLDDAPSELGNTDEMLEKEYLQDRNESISHDSDDDGDDGDGNDDDSGLKRTILPHFLSDAVDEMSPPEKSLRNIHLYEKENPPCAPSIGILYKERDREVPNASKFGHHSVFAKRKRHKLKNPFRVYEDEDCNMSEDLTSRYFNSQSSNNGKCNDSQDEPNVTQKQDSANVICSKSNEVDVNAIDRDSPPDSKRVKLSLVEYLDSQSKISLKNEASRMLGLEKSPCSDLRKDTATGSDGCNADINKVDSFVDECKHGVGNESENLERSNNLRAIGNTSDRNGINTIGGTLSSKDPPLPSLPFSLPDQENQKQHNSLKSFARSERCNDSPLSGRMSLFKFARAKHVSSLSEDMASQESKLTFQERNSDDNDKRASSLHLQARSLSEPTLQRRSTSKPPLTMGKCKSIGLTKRSKSSLDRVREKDTKLLQQKIGFQRFSYTKKSIKTKENSDNDVICIT